LPLPNQPGAVNYAYLSQPYTKWDQGLTRIDHRISDKDQLSGHYLIQNYAQPTVGAIPQFRSEADYLNQNVRFRYQRGFRTSTNPRKGTDFSAASVGINGPLQGGPNGRPLTKQEAGFPTLSISGFLGIAETGGSDYDFSRTFQIVGYVRRRHYQLALWPDRLHQRYQRQCSVGFHAWLSA